MTVRSAGGHVLRHFRKNIVAKDAESKKFVATFVVADVKRPILSIDKLTVLGFEAVLGKKDNSYLRHESG